MAVAPIFPVLLLVAAVRCRSDQSNGYNTQSGSGASQFGSLLKPPPPPAPSSILPMPFHREPERNQRQNANNGYQYQPPQSQQFQTPSPPLYQTPPRQQYQTPPPQQYQTPPPQQYQTPSPPLYQTPPPQQFQTPLPPQYQTPPPPLPSNNMFKFPAPFYKQYNFNFVPPVPQPFTTTPGPSMFQKLSGWLFPSQQTSQETPTAFNSNNKVVPIKKDCNPCNLVPWLPVITYNVGAKDVYPNNLPTYGPPSHTSNADSVKLIQKHPQPFNVEIQDVKPPQLTPGTPHAEYGPPTQNNNNNNLIEIGSTYGPPSATHTLDVLPYSPPTSTFSIPNLSHNSPSTSFSLPSTSINSQFSTTPLQQFSSNAYHVPTTTFRPHSFSQGIHSIVQGVTPPPLTYLPGNHNYDPHTLNKELPQQGDVEFINNIVPMTELQLPETTQKAIFKNSYGEPITNTHLLDIPYPVSSIAAESTKVKTKALPQENKKAVNPNISFSLANPAPFSMNRGRNIHTLQPVALPNLSVSPLPPIFNARPFRQKIPSTILQSINHMQQSSTNVNIQQSIPLTEFTHSVDYPPTVIQSPVIEIDAPVLSNQTKGYRNIPNSYVVDEIRDISSQASEDHISATKTISEASFESTGFDFGNELYDSGIPTVLKDIPRVPPNHKPNFADLRGLNDEELDKYRTENNLQHIDSPLLYLRPSAPHKNHGNFVLAISSPAPENDYEIYDDTPTTVAPSTPNLSNNWDTIRTTYDEELSSPSAQENTYKPKVVQIIVPYMTDFEDEEKQDNIIQIGKDWSLKPEDKYQARKIPSNTTNNNIIKSTPKYNTDRTTFEETLSPITDSDDISDSDTESDNLKDIYDIKEPPPFDIIKLQHTIDDWTVQEYSNQHTTLQRTRSSEHYAKQIPDDFFTTTLPTNYVTTTSNYDYDIFDHEGSSSIQHSVTDDSSKNASISPHNEYKNIDRPKPLQFSGKDDEVHEIQKPHIYTAASSFRITSTTTTPAPWGKIQTSISPLTKEKVYVVTSKPWKDLRNGSNDWYEIDPFESKKSYSDNESHVSNKFPFKSPRFINRPSFGFTSGGKIESDASYGFSRSWYQTINELENAESRNKTSSIPDTKQKVAPD